MSWNYYTIEFVAWYAFKAFSVFCPYPSLGYPLKSILINKSDAGIIIDLSIFLYSLDVNTPENTGEDKVSWLIPLFEGNLRYMDAVGYLDKLVVRNLVLHC